MLRILRSLPLVLAGAMLMAPAAATAATKKTVYPSVSKVSPLKLAVGDQLTIKGSGFRAGAGKTTVVFQRNGKPAIFVKATKATSTSVVVRVPEKLAAYLVLKDGVAMPTTFKLRVLAARFAKKWTTAKTSPTIAPKAAAAGGALAAPAPALTPYEQCQAAARADGAGDADGDGVSNGDESRYRMDPCNADTDGDGVGDGYEFYSGKDLNGTPEAAQRPYPNPLDPSDINKDFDGDGLSEAQEFRLWMYAGAHLPLTVYSDGTQNTGGTMPTVTPAQNALDLDRDHNLTDDERDADGDGVSNVVELQYRGTVGWWTKAYTDEKPYTAASFYELDPTNPDTDGDDIWDGADDQDHDGFSNVVEMEQSRSQAALVVQPYNPCLPNPYSLTCSRYVPFDNPWPPFDDAYGALAWDGTSGALTPFSVPAVMTTVKADAWNGNGGPQGP